WPDWLQVDFTGQKSIDEIDIFSLQDDEGTTQAPTSNSTFSIEGTTDFDAQYWNGSAWTTVPNGHISNNNLVWRQITFAPITTSKIRLVINNAQAHQSRIVELEAWGTAVAVSNVNWVVTDQLGTPRMICDQSGSLTVTDQNGNYVRGMTRHDYLPF